MFSIFSCLNYKYYLYNLIFLLYFTVMEQQKNLILKQYNQQEYQHFAQQLRKNKQMMFEILQKAPKVGVYKHQQQKDWHIFFKFYIDFLKSQQGPRGECAKAIRKRLLADEQIVAKLLAPFNLHPQKHIRQIYMKIKAYIPCPEYVEMKKFEEMCEKYWSNIERFQDENSPMVKHISDGLIKKHGENYDLKAHLTTLKMNYVKKLQQGNETLKKLSQVVENCQGYHQLLAVQKYFDSYFAEWKLADSEMGKENCKTGQLFQEKVLKIMLPYIYYSEKHDKNWPYSQKKLEVFQNLSWIPRNLGEIDIALGYKDQKQDRYFITTLIECKSRFFDLREAYHQVSLEQQGGINKGPTFEQLKAAKKIRQQQSKNSKNKAQAKLQANLQSKQQAQNKQSQHKSLVIKNKKFLSTKYGPAELVAKHHFYIITNLPQNQFVLPIESKMKEGIEKYTRNMFLQDIQSQSLYLCLQQRFQNIMSPFDWLKQYQAQWKGQQSNILVLK